MVTLTPVYTATALLLVDLAPKDLLDETASSSGSGSDSFRVDSEVEIANSDKTLRLVAQRLDLVNDPEFGSGRSWRDALALPFGPSRPELPSADIALQRAVNNLRAALKIERRDLTFVIAIETRSSRPAFAARVANEIARTYIELQVAAKTETTIAARDNLKLRLAEAAATVATSDADFNSRLDLSSGRAAQQTGRSDLAVLRSQLQTLLATRDMPEGLDGALAPDMLAELYELQQAAAVARAQYQVLLTRQRVLDVQSFLQVADSRIVSDATAPGLPSFPDPRLMFGAAVGLGLGFGVGLVLLVEHFVGGFTSAVQLESVLRLPVAAEIPQVRGPRREERVRRLADALITQPLSGFSEAIRRTRLVIDQTFRTSAPQAGPSTGRVVLVTSAEPDEGKTTLALSLARAYALSRSKTLLIDSDLRDPGLHGHLEVKSSEGLLDYLSGSGDRPEDLEAIIGLDTDSGARIIFGARRGNVATDQLVAGRTFSRLIAAARENFDIVILDSPAIGSVVDGLYLAGIADVVVLVVKWSATPQQNVRSAVKALLAARRDGTGLLTVLNQHDMNRLSLPGPRGHKRA